MITVDGVNSLPSQVCDRLAGSEQIREIDLNRIHARNVVHHYSDLASVLWEGASPTDFGKRGRKSSQCRRAGLETSGEGFRPVGNRCFKRRY